MVKCIVGKRQILSRGLPHLYRDDGPTSCLASRLVSRLVRLNGPHMASAPVVAEVGTAAGPNLQHLAGQLLDKILSPMAYNLDDVHQHDQALSVSNAICGFALNRSGIPSPIPRVI